MRSRSCLTKRTYGSRGEAKEHALKGCKPYKCRYCGFWHNGHKSKILEGRAELRRRRSIGDFETGKES